MWKRSGVWLTPNTNCKNTGDDAARHRLLDAQEFYEGHPSVSAGGGPGLPCPSFVFAAFLDAFFSGGRDVLRSIPFENFFCRLRLLGAVGMHRHQDAAIA